MSLSLYVRERLAAFLVLYRPEQLRSHPSRVEEEHQLRYPLPPARGDESFLLHEHDFSDGGKLIGIHPDKIDAR